MNSRKLATPGEDEGGEREKQGGEKLEVEVEVAWKKSDEVEEKEQTGTQD